MRMREARRVAREKTRYRDRGEKDPTPGPPDWDAVAREGVRVLATQSKDMEAATALTEALLRDAGLAGLAEGAKAITLLLESFWGALHPAPDPGEDLAATCLRPLAALLSGAGGGTLMRPIQLQPFFEMDDGRIATLTTFDEALAVDRLDHEQKERRVSEGALTSEALAALAARRPGQVQTLARDAEAAADAWRRMDAALDARAGVHKPPTRTVLERLEQIARFARNLVPQAPAVEQQRSADPVLAAGETAVPALVGPATGGAIASREEALRRLTEVAAWFRRAEPHSPLSYTLDEAVRRGRMGLPELLSEVVGDYAERARILTALGIRPPPEIME